MSRDHEEKRRGLDSLVRGGQIVSRALSTEGMPVGVPLPPPPRRNPRGVTTGRSA